MDEAKNEGVVSGARSSENSAASSSRSKPRVTRSGASGAGSHVKPLSSDAAIRAVKATTPSKPRVSAADSAEGSGTIKRFNPSKKLSAAELPAETAPKPSQPKAAAPKPSQPKAAEQKPASASSGQQKRTSPANKPAEPAPEKRRPERSESEPGSTGVIRRSSTESVKHASQERRLAQEQRKRPPQHRPGRNGAPQGAVRREQKPRPVTRETSPDGRKNDMAVQLAKGLGTATRKVRGGAQAAKATYRRSSGRAKTVLWSIVAVLGICMLAVLLLYQSGSSLLSDKDILRAVTVDLAETGFTSYGEPNETVFISETELSASSLSPSELTSSDTSPALFGERSSGSKSFGTALKLGVSSLVSKNSGVKLAVKCEAGTESVTGADFALEDNSETQLLTNVSPAMLKKVGSYSVRVKNGSREVNSILIVVDTTPPTAEANDCTIWIGDEFDGLSLVKNISDASAVRVMFQNEPDVSVVGSQLVYFHVEDEWGNSSELYGAQLTVREDTEPPVIKGAKDQRIVIGSSVSYKKGVTVTDNRDTDIKLKVDSSAVNATKSGTYNVIYSATDKAGNTASVTVKFTFANKQALSTEEQLANYVGKVVKKIIKSGMSDKEKAKAIYNWARSNISYSGHADKGNWKKAAVQGFKNHKGDCYTYFACTKALFVECGIKNIDVEKIKKAGRSMHYWSLIDCGSGYYHFDATPRVGGFNGFMLTDAKLLSYSKKHKNSHDFDASLYPATPKS